MTLAFSIQKALDSVFARVALEAARAGQAPAVGRAEAAALATVCRDILRGFALRLGPLVRSADFDSDEDIVTIDLDIDSDASLAPVAGNVLCSALCLAIMAQLHCGTAAEAEYCSQSEAELAVMLVAAPPHIRPACY